MDENNFNKINQHHNYELKKVDSNIDLAVFIIILYLGMFLGKKLLAYLFFGKKNSNFFKSLIQVNLFLRV
jgi:hypothetical protein